MHNGKLGGVGNKAIVTSVLGRQYLALFPGLPQFQSAKAGAREGLGTRLAIPARDPA